MSYDASREAELARTPVSARGIVARAHAGIASPRQAIKARCLQCSNYQRDEITNCTVVGCALWTYRPFQPDATEEASDA
jgi:hypothetical protein